MTEVVATVVVDLGPLKRFQTQMEADLRRSTNGPIRDAFRQWAARYRGFLRERYDRFSRGGGSWPALSPNTVRRRRGYAKALKKFLKSRNPSAQFSFKTSILRDTNTMFAVVQPTFSGKPGQLEEHVSFGVKVGFGGPGRYVGGGKATIADIASFHQKGGPSLPKREIVVAPDSTTISAMSGDMDRAIIKMQKDTGNH